jgi:hypothetical protein
MQKRELRKVFLASQGNININHYLSCIGKTGSKRRICFANEPSKPNFSLCSISLMPAYLLRVVTYIKQLFYIHFFIDLFSKNILVLPNKHNIGVCQIHSWFLLRGKDMGNKSISGLICEIII